MLILHISPVKDSGHAALASSFQFPPTPQGASSTGKGSHAPSLRVILSCCKHLSFYTRFALGGLYAARSNKGLPGPDIKDRSICCTHLSQAPAKRGVFSRSCQFTCLSLSSGMRSYCPLQHRQSQLRVGMKKRGIALNQGTIEAGFEPAVACYEHAAKPSAIRICCSCLSRHSFRIHAGFEPAASRSETGRSPLELMDSAELLSVSFFPFSRCR